MLQFNMFINGALDIDNTYLLTLAVFIVVTAQNVQIIHVLIDIEF